MSEREEEFKQSLAKVDARLEKLKEDVAMGKAVEEMHEEANFKKVVLEGYYQAEEKRISSLLFNPTTLKREQLENLMDKATAIRNYKNYFQTLLINASMAPEQIEEEEEYRKQITADYALNSDKE